MSTITPLVCPHYAQTLCSCVHCLQGSHRRTGAEGWAVSQRVSLIQVNVKSLFYFATSPQKPQSSCLSFSGSWNYGHVLPYLQCSAVELHLLLLYHMSVPKLMNHPSDWSYYQTKTISIDLIPSEHTSTPVMVKDTKAGRAWVDYVGDRACGFIFEERSWTYYGKCIV